MEWILGTLVGLTYIAVGFFVVGILDGTEGGTGDFSAIIFVFWPIVVVALIVFGVLYFTYSAGRWIGDKIGDLL